MLFELFAFDIKNTENTKKSENTIMFYFVYIYISCTIKSFL